jgi:hypothetical protein
MRVYSRNSIVEGYLSRQTQPIPDSVLIPLSCALYLSPEDYPRAGESVWDPARARKYPRGLLL